MWLISRAEYQAEYQWCKFQVVCGLGPRVPDRALPVAEKRAWQNCVNEHCWGEVMPWGRSGDGKSWCWFPSVHGEIQRNLRDKLTLAFYLSEESVCSPVRSPNYSVSDVNPRIALLLMAVFCKCQTKILHTLKWGMEGEGKQIEIVVVS